MVSVVYRDGKAKIIAGIVLFGVGLFLLWLVPIIFLTTDETIPMWFWMIIFVLTGLNIAINCILAAMLIGAKAIISDYSLAMVFFRKKREILKKNILFIADMPLGQGDRFYVVYPIGYEQQLIDKHLSVYTNTHERDIFIQKDKRLLVFTKTKRMSELLSKFGYASLIKMIDD